MTRDVDSGWNGGTGRELRSGDDHLEESVYCVACGTIFVRTRHRDCPACTNRERLEELEDRVAALEADDETIAEHVVESHETIDDRLDALEERLDRAERDIDIIDGGGF